MHRFVTDDGVELQLTRFRGGAKGPVILSPGFGTSSIAYTIDTTETNFPEYLYEHGYDVWVFDYRASPLLPSSGTQFTLDDMAQFEYPAAVRGGRFRGRVMRHFYHLGIGAVYWVRHRLTERRRPGEADTNGDGGRARGAR